jgi:hypothetical protein
MARIYVLKPNVTQEEAMEMLSSRGISGPVKNFFLGELRSVADCYIPFRIFQVEVENRGQKSSHILGLDAVNGSLDPYHFDHLPAPNDLDLKETRNRLPAALSDEDAQRLIADKVRRLIFTQGFFRVRDFRIRAEVVAGEIYIPYWAGFRGRGSYMNVAVLDAVRRKMEGARVRQMLRQWLTSAQ